MQKTGSYIREHWSPSRSTLNSAIGRKSEGRAIVEASLTEDVTTSRQDSETEIRALILEAALRGRPIDEPLGKIADALAPVLDSRRGNFYVLDTVSNAFQRIEDPRDGAAAVGGRSLDVEDAALGARLAGDEHVEIADGGATV